MEEAERYKRLREALIGLILSIDQVIPLSEQNMVLILLKLNTSEKIRQFVRWGRTKLGPDGENDLRATEEEIVRAAVWIDRGETPE